MNVLHFINNLNREGAQVMVANLVTAANPGGVNYSVCVRQPGGSLVDELRERGIKVQEPTRRYGFFSLLRSVRFLENVCLKNRVQIIHAHMADAAFLGWLVARKLNLPLVITHHGQDILLKCNPVCRFVYHVFLMLSARYAAMNIAVSGSVAEQVRRLLAVNEKGLQVISNGVKVPAVALLRDRQDRNEGALAALKLVSVGRLVPLKGQRRLIQAMAKLVCRFPGIRLYIVGGGELESELKQLAQIEKVADHIEFTGAVDDVSEYLINADIYLSSSQSEGMPVSVLEAMAWRLPVIASDIPGNRSVVKHGETGFLYELGDLDDLIATVVQVLNNRELARSVADRARAMVEQHYSACVSEQKHVDMYQAILAG